MDEIKLYFCDIEHKKTISNIVDSISLDAHFDDKIMELNGVLHKNDNFNFVECTIEISTKKKGRIISVYDQSKYEDWLYKIIELPDDWDKTKLFYKQKLYVRIYLDKYDYPDGWEKKDLSNIHKGYLFICIDNAVARGKQYKCEHLDKPEFIDEFIGIKPYKKIILYDPFREYFYIKAPEYIWHMKLRFCPICGVDLEYKEEIDLEED